MMDKILVSKCLLGALVRYDGKSKPISHPLLTKWHNQGRLISICPEVAGGLLVPRAAAEIQQDGQVITTLGENVTAAFETGAQQALAKCQQLNIRFALLKESSPSCGRNTIYDGCFQGRKISGQGITTQLLLTHGIAVFSEEEIELLSQALRQVERS